VAGRLRDTMIRMRALVAALVLIGACSSGLSSTPTASLPTASPGQGIPTATPSPTHSPSPTPSQTPQAPPTQSPLVAPAPVVELRSSKNRRPGGTAGVAALAAADADLAFRLYHELTAENSDNLFFSPYSISTAFSMQLGGARGNTADEIATVLGVGNDEAAWHDARNRLELALASLQGRFLPGEGDATPLTLETANAIFGQTDYAFKEEFLDLLAAYYGAGMQTVDFGSDPEAARLGINAWVAERTRDRIEELLKRGSITDLTRAVLVNAIYFKAGWV
jgi:serpin (serine protease inhibitor)